MTVTVYYNSKRDLGGYEADFEVICDARYVRFINNKLIIKGDWPREIDLSDVKFYDIENN